MDELLKNDGWEEFLEEQLDIYKRKFAQADRAAPLSPSSLRYLDKVYERRRELEGIRREKANDREKYSPVFNYALLKMMRVLAKYVPIESKKTVSDEIQQAVDQHNKDNRDFQITVFKEAEEELAKAKIKRDNGGTESI